MCIRDSANSTEPDAAVTTIYNIQYTTDIGEGTYDCFPSPYGVFENEQYVTTTGVVTAVQPTDNPNFFIQDFSTNSYAGINIFDNTTPRYISR